MENFHENDHHERCHRHEIQGSVRVAEHDCEAHNHRFAGISGEAIPMGQSHVHEVRFTTDTYENHDHEFCGRTSPAYPICGGHVHYLESTTSRDDGHCHSFRVISNIEDPTEK